MPLVPHRHADSEQARRLRRFIELHTRAFLGVGTPLQQVDFGSHSEEEKICLRPPPGISQGNLFAEDKTIHRKRAESAKEGGDNARSRPGATR